MVGRRRKVVEVSNESWPANVPPTPEFVAIRAKLREQRSFEIVPCGPRELEKIQDILSVNEMIKHTDLASFEIKLEVKIFTLMASLKA
jgi:hypothetical protein